MKALSPPLSPGHRLGLYELLRLVGRGGMGEVWLARSRANDALVAVKTLLAFGADNDKARRMFLDEASLMARVRHENVARVLDQGEAEGGLFYVMEWIDGVSLDELERAAAQRGRRLSIPVLLRIVRDAARGLHAAHELKDAHGQPLDVVHRDVSPHNVLLRRDGVAKVTDFGIARAKDRAAGRTTKGNFRGKLRYVAPEQALGEAVDRRADVWSLGVVLYEGLCGESPFESSLQASVLSRVLTGNVSFVFDDSVPRELVGILRRALARHPDARLATAQALAVALDQLVANLKLEASPAEVAAEMDVLLGQELAVRSQRLDASRSRLAGAALERGPDLVEVEAAAPGAASGVRPLLREPSEVTLPSTPVAALEGLRLRRPSRWLAAVLLVVAAAGFGVLRARDWMIDAGLPDDAPSTSDAPAAGPSSPALPPVRTTLARPRPLPSTERRTSEDDSRF